MKHLKLGLVGCGRIAQFHFQAIKEVASLELVAACDTDISRAKDVAKSWGVRWVTDKIEEVYSNNEIDAVLICLPHHLHRDTVIKAAKSGKHVFVEKPLGRFVSECDEMISACEESGVILMVGHVMRFSYEFRRIKKVIEEGNIGIPISIRVRRLTYHEKPAAGWWRSREMCGGLVIPLNGSHTFDTIFWFTNASPKKVFAAGRTVRNDMWEGEDEADVMIVLDSGVVASVALSFNCQKGINDILVVGSKNSLLVSEENLVVDRNKERPTEKFVLQMREFASSILERRPPAVDGNEARKTVAVIEAAESSIETGKVIEL